VASCEESAMSDALLQTLRRPSHYPASIRASGRNWRRPGVWAWGDSSLKKRPCLQGFSERVLACDNASKVSRDPRAGSSPPPRGAQIAAWSSRRQRSGCRPAASPPASAAATRTDRARDERSLTAGGACSRGTDPVCRPEGVRRSGSTGGPAPCRCELVLRPRPVLLLTKRARVFRRQST
jgi:hypothetical protein